MKRSFYLVITMALALCAPAMADLAGQLSGEGGATSITGTFAPGEVKSYTLSYNIEITGGTGGQADVLFLTDTTGSMGGYIGGTQAALSNILTSIAVSLPGLDIHYAVADYRNYCDGGKYTSYGVNLIQPFTSNASLVQSAIDSMYANGGDDTEESQLKAMVSVAANWMTPSGDLGFAGRAGAQKIIVWAGDYWGHIAGDESWSSCVPPDGYYPSLDAAIAALNTQGIQVFGLNIFDATWGINYPYPGYFSQTAPVAQQDAVTSATGGLSFYSVGSGGPSISDAIVASITGGVETLNNITLNLSGSTGGFIIDPLSQTLIGSFTADDSPVTGSFSFNATAPGIEGAEAAFDMVLLGNGAELDRVTVTLKVSSNTAPDVSGVYPSMDCLGLASHKMAAVQILGVTDADGDPVTITITGITSDEPTATVLGAGGVNHAPDADGVGTDTAYLLGERSAQGDGRVYVISFLASDGMGGVTAGSVAVKVPKKMGTCEAVDSGQLYDATAIN